MAQIKEKKKLKILFTCRKPPPQRAMQVQIHYHRSLEGTTIYTEDFVSDDGRRLRTFVDLPEHHRRSISEQLWGVGVLPRPQVVATIRKFYFYTEPFDVLEFRYEDGA